MITELNIVQAYEMLKVTQAAAYEAGEAAIEAKNTLELKRLEGLADGTISGKNQAMRDAAAAELLAADYAAVEQSEANARTARLDLELARADVSKAQALLRLAELTHGD